jgi:hypothetical protein
MKKIFDLVIIQEDTVFPRILSICGTELKGHGNEADFLGFLQKLVPHVDPLHYLSSNSYFGFEFAEIFVIKK